jgi:murein L,D-transpeptidase YcbB/YkuD
MQQIRAAVQKVQTMVGATASGVWDVATQNAVKADLEYIQGQLHRLGRLTEEPSGCMTEATDAAIKNIQTQHGLKRDGILTDLTREAIETEFQNKSG